MPPEQKDNTASTTKQEAVFYIVRKVERLVSTVHILCDIIKDNVDMADSVRKKTYPILEAALALQSSRTTHTEDTIIKIKDELRTLEVYLATAALARVISSMNARIVREELFDLIAYIEKETETILNEQNTTVRLHRTSFAVEDVARPRSVTQSGNIPLQSMPDPLVARRLERTEAKQQPESVKDIMYKRHEQSDLYNDIYSPTPAPHPAPAQKTPEQKPPENKRAQWQAERSAVKQKSRRLEILSILQKKDAITIKDVAEVITDCSEKTLQRELLSMVESGVLKKQGERRWSTYSLA